jgi:hypothetical protein
MKKKTKKNAKTVSEREQHRRARQSATAQLLYDRATTSHLLGDISLSTLVRLEQSGQLVAVKPSGCENGKVFYTSASVHRLAGIVEPQVSEVA